MIDIHSHLIFDTDDGPSTIKESIRMVLEAEKIGIKTIIATPHYKKNVFNIDNAEKNFKELLIRLADCDIELRLGYEVFVESLLLDCIDNKRIFTLNNSQYLLFELPFDVYPANTVDIILNLHLENIIPIIAHPERHIYFQRDFGKFLGLIEAGCMVQLDAGSIMGIHGRKSKAFCKKVLKLGLAQFIASDAHSAKDYTNLFLPSYHKVVKWVGTDYAESLYRRNQELIFR
ncbi:tyrosine-protein phosphatase [Pseudobacteroides cellulosolvens]|uniref:protein-tyrosine-phosphatase n=1 Tax=Pseudobacteroides cellulosolvens ATCC 35603 = DSM 2933 TaxID=398512 RepID=A0A0L6JIK8_9FIRM|nr:CpsB/CapC family capsule biosynthesis tyrosine phosphatase [Pseudobacteroides cellulosolvens]KNY25565.1 Protein-tyrosine-phosphatase [Pseudobacteroides cellulosolvens ATCC 35603 = DSM 2933]